MSTILLIDDQKAINVSLAGGKGASLAEMVSAQFPVPPGFIVSADVFARFIEEEDINVEIASQLGKVNKDDLASVEAASEILTQLIMKSSLLDEICDDIQQAYEKLGAEFVAVRSSATAEDSEIDSWAGELDTFLNTTSETLLKNIQKCWASLYTPRAIFYRAERNMGPEDVSVAVVVQKMIQSEIAGVAFSVHPITKDHNQMVIEAGYGLGEALVSGQITPDTYVVEKTGNTILDANISEQKEMIVRGPDGGTVIKDVPAMKKEQQKLPQQLIDELADVVIRVEKHYGKPMDIEWAVDNGSLYLTQARPITTL